jgi:hypothetical protein
VQVLQDLAIKESQRAEKGQESGRELSLRQQELEVKEQELVLKESEVCVDAPAAPFAVLCCWPRPDFSFITRNS